MLVCDRCKESLATNEKGNFSITKSSTDKKYFDLCKDCRSKLFDEIEKWIKNDDK